MRGKHSKWCHLTAPAGPSLSGMLLKNQSESQYKSEYESQMLIISRIETNRDWVETCLKYIYINPTFKPWSCLSTNLKTCKPVDHAGLQFFQPATIMLRVSMSFSWRPGGSVPPSIYRSWWLPTATKSLPFFQGQGGRTAWRPGLQSQIIFTNFLAMTSGCAGRIWRFCGDSHDRLIGWDGIG